MSLDKIENTKIPLNGSLNNQTDNGQVPGDEFINLLHELVEEAKQIKVGKLDNSSQATSLSEIRSVDSYNSFKQLRVNHLNGKIANSQLVSKILSVEEQSERNEKLLSVKKKLEEGFYLRDDVIEDTAGKILNSLIG